MIQVCDTIVVLVFATLVEWFDPNQTCTQDNRYCPWCFFLYSRADCSRVSTAATRLSGILDTLYFHEGDEYHASSSLRICSERSDSRVPPVSVD